MSKPQKAEKIHPELRRAVEVHTKQGMLDTVLSGIITFTPNIDYKRTVDDFAQNYPGFNPVTTGQVTVFQSPAKYIVSISGHQEVVEMRLATEHYRH